MSSRVELLRDADVDAGVRQRTRALLVEWPQTLILRKTIALRRSAPGLSAVPQLVLGVLTRSTDPSRFDARYSQLMVAQRKAVAVALRALELESEGTLQKEVGDILDSYWRSLLHGKAA